MKKLVKLGRFSTGEAELQARLSRTWSACQFGIISTEKLIIPQIRNNLFLFNVKFPIIFYEFQFTVTQIWNVRLIKWAVIILHMIKQHSFKGFNERYTIPNEQSIRPIRISWPRPGQRTDEVTQFGAARLCDSATGRWPGDENRSWPLERPSDQ